LVAILAPIAWYLAAETTPRNERVMLVALAACLTYAIKVLHDPLMFVMSDEFIHLAAAQQLMATHALFGHLQVVGGTVATEYPGLQLVAVTVSQISGLSLFASGLLVIGVARAIVLLGLYHLYERTSGSPRVAGLGALLFAANGNFLFWSAQFSYESFSLPLFCVALFLIVERSRRTEGRPPLTLALALLIVAITATHHLTSYALAAFLWAFTLLSVRRGWGNARAVGLAVLGTGFAAYWFFSLATGTRSYLGYVFGRTIKAIKAAAQGNAHAPFQATAGSLQTPFAEQLVSFAAVFIVTFGVLWMVKRSRRLSALATPAGALLALGALGFLALYPLRLFPGAWETANRAQEFLFIGVALLLGMAIDQLRPGAGPARTRVALVGAILVVICGGVIAGWPAPLRLSPPLAVRVANATIVPQGVDVSRWAVSHLPAASVYVGDEATGRELAVDGARFAYLAQTGTVPGQLLDTTPFPAWQRSFVVDNGVDFLVVDRRQISANNQASYFFQTARRPDDGLGYYPLGARRKFAVPGVSAIFDSGDIVVYDVRGLEQSPRPCGAVGAPSLAVGTSCSSGGNILTFAGPDGTADLPGMRVRYLGTHVEPLGNGLLVTLLVQIQNFARQAYAADADWHHLYLTVDGQRVSRRVVVPGRRDNLVGTAMIEAGGKLEGSLTFILRGRLASWFERHGGQLGAVLPRPPARGSANQIGLIAIPPGTGR
jgi:hypothetical protein